MAALIQLHTLKTWGTVCLNRDDSGDVKDITVGGVRRVRISSQAVKHVMRDQFAGTSVRTRYIVDKWMSRLKAEPVQFSDDDLNAAESLFVQISGAQMKNGKQEVKQLTAYSTSEVDFIYKKVYDALISDSEEFKKTVAKKADKEKLAQNIIEQARGVSMDKEIAVFGRMTTGGVGQTVPSSVHKNHEYSIDKNLGEYDYFSAFDNFINQSAHLNPSSIASMTTYGYINIDPVQIYKNLTAHLSSTANQMSEEEKDTYRTWAKETTVDCVGKLVESVFTAIPGGKQNSNASYPTPSMVYMTCGMDIYPCTMDSVYHKIITPNKKESVVEQGINRAIEWINSDEYEQEYDVKLLGIDSQCHVNKCDHANCTNTKMNQFVEAAKEFTRKAMESIEE